MGNIFYKRCGLLLVAVASFLFLVQCKTGKSGGTDAARTESYGFSFPEIPSSLTRPEERQTYLMEHYWEEFDFSDSALVFNPQISEQAFADFVVLLPACPPSTVTIAIARLFKLSGSNMAAFRYFYQLAEKYWYDPNSPVRNEEHFLIALQTVVNMPSIPEIEKTRPQRLLALVSRNRPGQAATDFGFNLNGQKTSSLYKTNADFLILYFNNPGCESCAASRAGLLTAPNIGQLAEQGRLRILSLYPDGVPTPSSVPVTDMPGWIDAYDAEQAILNQNLYDLKAIPTLYLLDKDKKVLLKDASVGQIEAYLQGLGSAR